MTQLTLSAIDNKNLFSNYYLDNQIKNNPEWKKDEFKAVFSKIKNKYDAENASFSVYNEAQLIKHFLDPVFEILLYESEVEAAEMGKFPDYAFFKDKSARDEAHKNKGTYSFYRNALAIGEVKRWDTELDGKPSQQLWNYLDDAGLKWGILTNGRKWRLYCRGNEKKRDEYYEIDLPSLLGSNDIEGFKYFFYFFRRDAFLLPENFLEQVLRESEDHAKAIGNNLKENVYKAMKKIADGFFGRPQNNLDKNDGAAQELVQKNTMLLLYRLLFLLYAEDRNLLDVTKPKYLNNHSFRKIKKEVEEKRGRIEQSYDNSGTTIWDRLKSLFELINLGSEALGEKEFHVPAYNGGLFDSAKNPELERWKIGDKYLAEAIHLMTWSGIKDGGFVDYSELEIRHLGSIYEGLLEYKLKVAESDIVTKENEWVSIEKYNESRKQKKTFEEFDEFSHTRKGELYLATDKGERKTTGSYYTPDYIVNYIVKNTVGPVIDEKWKDAQAKNQSFVNATLSVKVLDPAMGSGHFLVGAVEFLAEKLLKAAQKDIEAMRMVDEPHFSDPDWARREVVAHCIYGVDLNPMAVELAKVGLWLTTISKEKPLSFLDHRLKQGNSLIGAQLIDLPWYPDLKAKTKTKENTVLQKFEEEVHIPFVDKIVQQLNALSEIDDDTIEHTNQKKALFEKLKENKQYLQIKSIADVYTAVYFGNETTEVNKNPKFAYNDLFWALKGDDREWSRKTYKPWFKTAMEIARDKSFFHWELEFPEIFFEGGAPKENPGWDAVVGNPPYVRVDSIPIDDKRYYASRFSTPYGKYDIYYIFVEWGCALVTQRGRFSYIIPNRFCSNDTGIKLRELLGNARLHVEVVSMFKVFGDASVYPVIIVRSADTPMLTISHPADTQKMGEKIDVKINADEWRSIPKKVIPIQATAEGMSLTVNIYRLSQQLEEIVDISEGLRFPREAIIDRVEKVDTIGLVLQYQFSRYTPIFPHAQIAESYVNANQNQETKRMKLSRMQKIIFAEDALFFHGTLDKKGLIPQGGVYFATLKEESKYDLLALLAVLNAKVSTFVFKTLWSGIHMGGGFLRFRTENVGTIPIRRISFTTPPDRCTALVDQAKALYSEYLGAPGADNLDRINRTDTAVNPVHPVQTVASLSAAPDTQKILDFVNARLFAAPEESDVVHDLLAYLAERMIEMNKEKNAEIKGFLHWFEGEIGAPVEELTNKTAIKEYYEAGFDALAGALAKNKKKLKDGYDPTRREPKEKLQAEFNTSVGKLAPLLKRIQATDGLIDQIVYKLYGLTEDEIKIVEESISGGKDAKETGIAG